MNLPIYLDNAATTKIDPEVLAAMLPYLNEDYGNPASIHSLGQNANNAVEKSRLNIAQATGSSALEIIFTSGATESSNLAIIGASRFYKTRGNHLITLTTEHKATLDTMRYLETDGFSVTYLNPNSDGLLDIQKLKAAIRPDTILISIAFVNSEIGVIQDISTISRLCIEHNIIFHVDAAQAFGKVMFDLSKLNINLMSFSAHKIYGPKGVGALYVKRHPRTRIMPIIHGGGHERGFRSGTLPTHQIVGMGEAFKIASTNLATDIKKITALQDKFLAGIKAIPQFFINGSLSSRIPHNINIGFTGINANDLLSELKNIMYASTGSACSSALLEPSYVLKALGLSDEQASSAIRITFSKWNTPEEVDFVVKSLYNSIRKLRI